MGNTKNQSPANATALSFAQKAKLRSDARAAKRTGEELEVTIISVQATTYGKLKVITEETGEMDAYPGAIQGTFKGGDKAIMVLGPALDKQGAPIMDKLGNEVINCFELRDKTGKFTQELAQRVVLNSYGLTQSAPSSLAASSVIDSDFQ